MPVGSGIGETEAAGVEADQPAERGDPLGVAVPVGLVHRLVDGDHEPAVELQHVDDAGPGFGSPHLVPHVQAAAQRVLGRGTLMTTAVCRADVRPAATTIGR